MREEEDDREVWRLGTVGEPHCGFMEHPAAPKVLGSSLVTRATNITVVSLSNSISLEWSIKRFGLDVTVSALSYSK